MSKSLCLAEWILYKEISASLCAPTAKYILDETDEIKQSERLYLSQYSMAEMHLLQYVIDEDYWL